MTTARSVRVRSTILVTTTAPGLREWLESATAESFDRTYDGPFAERLFEMEQPLMARFGYEASVLARPDETKQVPNTIHDYIVWDFPAPGRYDRKRSIVVRYARSTA